MSKEELPKPEFEERERALIKKLKEKSIEDPEAAAELAAWTEEQEKEATKEGNIEGKDAAHTSMQLDLKRARLYHAAGYRKEAWDLLNSIRNIANSLGIEDLRVEAELLMDRLDEEGI